MDPIADKILVLAAFLAFVEMKLVPAWMAVVIVLREITVTGLRVLALTEKRIIAADLAGKQKMVSQVVTIVAVLVFIIFREAGIKVFRFWTQSTERVYKDTIFVFMLITVILTVISGISYLVRNREVYSDAKKG
jgi:CDP-diacylglycerol--glycerol-3-phosphate 3-phosphatidyltransferase